MSNIYYNVYIDDYLVHGNEQTGIEDIVYRLLNGSVTETFGSASSCTFTMGFNHRWYDIGSVMRSRVRVYESARIIFDGRITEKTYNFDKSINYYCEGRLAYLNDMLYPPPQGLLLDENTPEYKSLTDFTEKVTSTRDIFERVIQYYNEYSLDEHRFTIGRIEIDSHDIYGEKIERDSCYNILKKYCVDRDGGYITLTGENTINWVAYPETPAQEGSVVRYGLNLLDLNQTIDATSIYTEYIVKVEVDSSERESDGSRPKDPETGEEEHHYQIFTYSDSDLVALYGSIEKYVDLGFVEYKIQDLTTSEPTETLDEYNARIRKMIEQKYKMECKKNIIINADIVELSPLNVRVGDVELADSDDTAPLYATPIQIGEIIKIESPHHAILDELPVSSIKYDILTLNKSLTIGGIEPSIAQIANNSNFKDGSEGGDKKKKEKKTKVKELHVIENGTYTAEKGYAYNPVYVDVPTGRINGTVVSATAEEDIHENDPVYFISHISVQLEDTESHYGPATAEHGEHGSGYEQSYNVNPYVSRCTNALVVNNIDGSKQFLTLDKYMFDRSTSWGGTRWVPKLKTINAQYDSRICIFCEYDKKYIICEYMDNPYIHNYHESGTGRSFANIYYNNSTNGQFYVFNAITGNMIDTFVDPTISAFVKIGHYSDDTDTPVYHVLNVKNKLWVSNESYYDLSTNQYVNNSSTKTSLFRYSGSRTIQLYGDDGYLCADTMATNSVGDNENVYYYSFSDHTAHKIYKDGIDGDNPYYITPHPWAGWKDMLKETGIYDPFYGFRSIIVNNKMYTFVPGGAAGETFPWTPSIIDVRDVTPNGISDITNQYILPASDRSVPHRNALIDYSVTENDVKLVTVAEDLKNIIFFDEASASLTSFNVADYYQSTCDEYYGVSDVKIMNAKYSVAICETYITVIITYICGALNTVDKKCDNILEIPIEEIYAMRKAKIGYANQNVNKGSIGEGLVLPSRDTAIIPKNPSATEGGDQNG